MIRMFRDEEYSVYAALQSWNAIIVALFYHKGRNTTKTKDLEYYIGIDILVFACWFSEHIAVEQLGNDHHFFFKFNHIR